MTIDTNAKENSCHLTLRSPLLTTGGTLLLLWSMWDVSGWAPQINNTTLIVATFLQGIGAGFVFVPVNLTAFATLAGYLCSDDTALTNLLRNIGNAPNDFLFMFYVRIPALVVIWLMKRPVRSPSALPQARVMEQYTAAVAAAREQPATACSHPSPSEDPGPGSTPTLSHHRPPLKGVRALSGRVRPSSPRCRRRNSRLPAAVRALRLP